MNYLLSLKLNNNQLSGTIPSSLGNLDYYLSTLLLNDNQLTGTIPTTMGRLKRVSELGWYGNQLTGAVPSGLCGVIVVYRYSSKKGCTVALDP